jgi:hypothetical protein
MSWESRAIPPNRNPRKPVKTRESLAMLKSWREDVSAEMMSEK